MENKYYAFRDLHKEGSFDEIAEYQAAGLIESFHDKGSKSEKDICVYFFCPFTAVMKREWRGINKIEIIEVEKWRYELLMGKYKNIEEIN